METETQEQKQIPRGEPLRDDNSATSPLSPLLPLDLAERSVCWRNAQGQVRTHVFRRITERDWNGYFSRMVFETDASSRTIDVNSAALWLYGECIQAVTGYSMRGGKELGDLPNWRERIPMNHRLQAVSLLTSAERSSGCAEIEPDCETVTLDALWDVDGKGGMRRFTGLVHRFTAPSAQQMMRYSRESSRSLVVGGSTNGKTIHAIRQKVLLKLYDELIQGVEGYAVPVGAEGYANPKKGIGKPEAIVREMDAFHKIAAAGQLFSTAAEEEGLEDAERAVAAAENAAMAILAGQ